MFSTSLVALMSPVLTSDPKYLHHYAYALRVSADTAERLGHPAMALRYRTRAYYLRTLAHKGWVP